MAAKITVFKAIPQADWEELGPMEYIYWQGKLWFVDDNSSLVSLSCGDVCSNCDLDGETFEIVTDKVTIEVSL